MKLDLEDFEKLRSMRVRETENREIEMITDPHTDLWQRTYYHFRNDSAPALLKTTDIQEFSFTFRVRFDSSVRFDQCGVLVYQSENSWIKASVEYENEDFGRLGSVVTSSGYSDWATQNYPADIRTLWFRLSRRGQDFCIEYSRDGKTFEQMRICHLFDADEEIHFGLYACSPEESSFTAVFDQLDFGECQWKAHDGQQPDADWSEQEALVF